VSNEFVPGCIYLTPRSEILFVVEVIAADRECARLRSLLPEGRVEELCVPFYCWKKLDG
jgi:hypothetical protein